MRLLSNNERRDWLRLARTPNVGPVTFATLIARFGSAAAALEAIPRLALRGGARDFRIWPTADAEREMEALSEFGGRLIASCEPEFPLGLGLLDSPPPILSVLGDPQLLEREMVALVGARNASALGRKFASNLAMELGKAGLVVASGMARGIDAAAHEAALSTGSCAVVAGGIDVIYPQENTRLYQQLRDQGVIVTEMPFGESPQARHFPRRNRIISGLSRGVVIVEAAEGSGSLITANYALEQGREVFAVPGSPLDPRARGANRLIRQGANLVESADDVLQVLKPTLQNLLRERSSPVPIGPVTVGAGENDTARLRSALLALLTASPVATDELIRESDAPAREVAVALLELELAGRVLRHPGNRVSLG